MKLYFEDEGFDGQLQRTVCKCDSRMANVGECLYIASRITAGDRDSWYAEWSKFADGLVARAAVAAQAGHVTSAASLRLRAAEYYRQAFFWHRDDLRHPDVGGTGPSTAWEAMCRDVSQVLEAAQGGVGERQDRAAALVAACYVLAIWARYRLDAATSATPALRARVAWLCSLVDAAVPTLKGHADE